MNLYANGGLSKNELRIKIGNLAFAKNEDTIKKITKVLDENTHREWLSEFKGKKILIVNGLVNLKERKCQLSGCMEWHELVRHGLLLKLLKKMGDHIVSWGHLMTIFKIMIQLAGLLYWMNYVLMIYSTVTY